MPEKSSGRWCINVVPTLRSIETQVIHDYKRVSLSELDSVRYTSASTDVYSIRGVP
ncbi:hypothetical protein HOH45_07775 [bacterium]|nr:hypothetical protein [bacterium]